MRRERNSKHDITMATWRKSWAKISHWLFVLVVYSQFLLIIRKGERKRKKESGNSNYSMTLDYSWIVIIHHHFREKHRQFFKCLDYLLRIFFEKYQKKVMDGDHKILSRSRFFSRNMTSNFWVSNVNAVVEVIWTSQAF